VLRHWNRTRGYIHIPRRAHEDLVRGLRLVGRHLVASVENAGEGEVGVLAREAVGRGRERPGGEEEGGITRGGKGEVVRMGDGEGGGLTSEPVACVIAVIRSQGC